MKTSLEHLPPAKQRHVAAIVEEITKAANVEMVILFGSHARGDWVEDPVGGYFSDYDVLVIVESEKLVEKHDLWSKIESRAGNRLGERRVLSMIVHDVEDVNRREGSSRARGSDLPAADRGASTLERRLICMRAQRVTNPTGTP